MPSLLVNGLLNSQPPLLGNSFAAQSLESYRYRLRSISNAKPKTFVQLKNHFTIITISFPLNHYLGIMKPYYQKLKFLLSMYLPGGKQRGDRFVRSEIWHHAQKTYAITLYSTYPAKQSEIKSINFEPALDFFSKNLTPFPNPFP